MNDYSRNFKNPDSFITSVVFNQKENTFSVVFANHQMFVWDITRENVERIANMLTAQYNEVIKNQKSILKNNKWTQGAIAVLVTMLALCIGSNAMELAPNITNILTTISVSLGMASSFTIAANELGVKKSFKERLSVAKEFLENRDELTEVMCTERNIASEINQKTEREIREQTYLAGRDIVDMPASIFMLDAAMNNHNLDDIRSMLAKLRTYRGVLTETAEFKGTKKRIRTKKTNS